MIASRTNVRLLFAAAGMLALSCSDDSTKPPETSTSSGQISLTRRLWYAASLPVDDLGIVKPANLQLGFVWYNIDPERGVHKRDLNPELAKKEDTLVQSMDIDLDNTPGAASDSAYAGVMRGFPNGSLDISQDQFLEVWVNDFKPDPITRGGKLHIDLGLIDENFHNPGKPDFDDEDKNHDGFAATFDDTGLDGVFDKDEPGYSSLNPDPNGDDFDPSKDALTMRYEKVNGTENNLVHDTEDLDRNGQMSRDNAYFSYVIDLADSADIDIRRQYPNYDGFNNPDHANDAWRKYRIPLADNKVIALQGILPRFDEIHHARIWFDHASSVVRTESGIGKNRIQIAEISIRSDRD